MISVDTEFYSSPYYFLIRDKGDKYSLYFSVEETLTEARKKDEVIHFDKKKGKKVKNYLEKTVKDKKKKSTKTLKTDLEELVNADGAMSNSAIPILDPRVGSEKTMDQIVPASRITNDPISRGYRTYFGESEMKETNLSKTFGNKETKDMDGPETYKYYIEELGMDEDEAKERTKEQGKDWTGKKDKKSEYYDDPNFISRETLSEIEKQKAIKVVEDMLTKKKNSDSSDINKKDIEVSRMLKRNLSVLKRQADKEGVSISELIKMLKSE